MRNFFKNNKPTREEIKELFSDLGQYIYRALGSRLLWLFVLAAALFYVLAGRLFRLQIIQGDIYSRAAPPRTREITIPIQALRGGIYDNKGRPLAVNNLAYVVKMDPSYAISNEALYALALLFERWDEDFVDDFPMTHDEPYAFTFAEQFSDDYWREWHEFRWKDDMAVPNPHEATASEAFDYLREYFRIDEELPGLSNAEVRKILNLRCMIFMERMLKMDAYSPTPITLAYDVKPQTVAAIEENNALFTGVYLEIEALREYPQGKYFSHMLGYIRRISEEELQNNAGRGYTSQDLIGKAGIERSMEAYLRGQNGVQSFEVNTAGRRTTAAAEAEEPVPGDRVFLTLDAELQRVTYDILEDYLCRTLAAKITLDDIREEPITLKQIYTSLINSNNLDIKAVLNAAENTDAYALRTYILDRFPEASAQRYEDMEKIKGILTDGVEAGRVTPSTLLLTMISVGQLTNTQDKLDLRLKNGNITAQQATIEKILEHELTPQMLNIDPCTGSVVVVDVRSGDVLAAAGYPSYDNNRLVNHFDSEYYNRINTGDPTLPMWNRPFMEAQAPGSTFKMITAAATLEAGVVTQASTIYDGHSFTKIGEPYTDCWSGVSHGYLNIVQALQVSCNYYFCEAAYRMSNSDTVFNAIKILNDFMIYFGLNDKTGVEIGEYYNIYDDTPALALRISSPEFKEYREKSIDPFAPRLRWEWYGGDTVRTAMGQSYNSYTAAVMARYISVIANRGVRYPLHLVNAVENHMGQTVMRYEAVPDAPELAVSDKTWDSIIEGMRLVTEGRGAYTGTAVTVFDGFPITVAGKTGTAQQTARRPDHTSFAAFAPYDEPQIAVYVSIPFGDTRAYTQISSRIAKDVIAAALGLDAEPERPEALNALTR